MGNLQYLEYDEAVALVISTTNRLISMIESLKEVNCADYITLFAEKFVLDCMDYCHRTHFPRTLVYTAAELAT